MLRVGRQDLTAHVNLTALRREAEAAGLSVSGITTQDRFLVANGILEGLDSDDDGPVGSTKRRAEVKQLIHPNGMGTMFKVAVLTKGLAPGTLVRGVGDPFDPHPIFDRRREDLRGQRY